MNCVAHSYVTELLRNYTPSCFEIVRLPHLCYASFKLKAVGDRSFRSSGPRARNSLPPSRYAGALACTDAFLTLSLPCFAAISWPLNFIKKYGLSPDSSSLPATCVVRLMSKCAYRPVAPYSIQHNPAL